MKKLSVTDIRGPKLYDGFRDDLRKRVIELKKKRRVSVGPLVTLLFENRATVIYQTEEMCRAEAIFEPEKIAEEVAAYNKLLPDAGEVAATLFVELTDPSTLEQSLDELVGLQDHVWLYAGDSKIRATFDAEQFKADRLAAVQYLRFVVDAEARAGLAVSGKVVIDHPNYRHDAALSDDTRKELLVDLG